MGDVRKETHFNLQIWLHTIQSTKFKFTAITFKDINMIVLKSLLI